MLHLVLWAWSAHRMAAKRQQTLLAGSKSERDNGKQQRQVWGVCRFFYRDTPHTQAVRKRGRMARGGVIVL